VMSDASCVIVAFLNCKMFVMHPNGAGGTLLSTTSASEMDVQNKPFVPGTALRRKFVHTNFSAACLCQIFK
jgi:hypothetical protein